MKFKKSSYKITMTDAHQKTVNGLTCNGFGIHKNGWFTVTDLETGLALGHYDLQRQAKHVVKELSKIKGPIKKALDSDDTLRDACIKLTRRAEKDDFCILEEVL